MIEGGREVSCTKKRGLIYKLFPSLDLWESTLTEIYRLRELILRVEWEVEQVKNMLEEMRNE